MSNEYKLSYTANDINTRLGRMPTALTTNRALMSDSSGNITASTVTATELGYLSGVTQSIKTQINNLKLSDIEAMSGSLKWDGVIGDKPYVVVEEGIPMTCYVHVSDVYPTMLEDKVIISLTNVAEQYHESMMMVATPEDDGFIDCGALIVPSDNYTSSDGLIFPKKGIYFMAQSYLNAGFDISYAYISSFRVVLGHVFKEENTETDKYFSRKVMVSDEATFDGNLTGKTYVTLAAGDGMQYYFVKIANADMSSFSAANGGVGSAYIFGQGIQRVALTSSDITVQDDGFINFADDLFLYIPTDNYVDGDIIFPEKGIYALCIILNGITYAYGASLSLPNVAFSASNIYIDTSYLPSGYPKFTSTLKEVLNSFSYTTTEDEYYEFEVTLAESINAGDICLVNWNGGVYRCEAFYNEIIAGVVLCETGDISNPGKFGIICESTTCVVCVLDNTTTGTVAIAKEISTLNPISENLLPESVEGVVIRSSTAGSTKKFKLTVDDSGIITVTEVTV